MAKNNWGAAFQSGNQKYANYWEAFGILEGFIKKEILKATPYNDMAERSRKEKRNIAVDKITERFIKGKREWDLHVPFILNIIEEAQNY